MELIDSSKKKVKKICDVLLRDTLEPAQRKAEEIIDEANKKAEAIILQAADKASGMVKEAEAQIKEKQTVFDSSLKIATQKALTMLRDEVEFKLFHPELENQIRKYLNQKEIVVKIIDALVEALKKEGLGADLELVISKAFKPEEICAAILQDSLNVLNGKVIRIGENESGITLKCSGYHLSIDVTDDAIKGVISTYASESLRKILFKL